MKITKYKEAFDLINVSITDKIMDCLKSLESEGYTEYTISYAIWKAQDKISQFRGDTRFIAILKNEVRKYAFKRA
jgi:hypothetical protein